VPYAEYVTSTTHKTLRGPRGGLILCRAAHAAAVDKQIFPGLQGGPLMHVIAAKAVCLREAQGEAFRAYGHRVVDNARAMAEEFLSLGVRLVSGGTDNHLVLLDVSSLGLTGRDAAAALDRSGIVVNKNSIPFDPQSPFVTSGVRIGTPGVTSRGMGADDMRAIARAIMDVLRHPGDAQVETRVRGWAAEAMARFPSA
jgi:glycine hydroxymethyltransferase